MRERGKNGVLILCVVISFALLLVFLIGAFSMRIFQFTLFIFPNGISCHIYRVYIIHIVYRIVVFIFSQNAPDPIHEQNFIDDDDDDHCSENKIDI